jgi:hypothetical protein
MRTVAALSYQCVQFSFVDIWILESDLRVKIVMWFTKGIRLIIVRNHVPRRNPKEYEAVSNQSEKYLCLLRFPELRLVMFVWSIRGTI